MPRESRCCEAEAPGPRKNRKGTETRVRVRFLFTQTKYHRFESCDANSDKDWDKFKINWLGTSRKSNPSRRKTNISVHFASFMGLCLDKTSPNRQRENRAPGGQRQRRRAIQTEQCSRSTEFQLRKWQQQDSWIQLPDFLAWLVKPTRQFQVIRRCQCRQFTKLLRLPKKECPPVWIRLPPSRRQKQWDAIEEPVVPLERTCTVIHGQDRCGKEDSKKFFSHKNWQTSQLGCLLMSTEHYSCSCPFM